MPEWINLLSACSLAVAVSCAAWITFDEWRYPQAMAIMNLVWPVTALYGGPLALWAYIAFGRARATAGHESKHQPNFATTAKSASHCGAGCTLGDMVAETLLILFPSLALALGWKTLWQDRIFSSWILDFILAFALGILFQYYSIRPMHPELGRATALRRALQADALSLISWQVGMYAAMGLAHFVIFPDVTGKELAPASLAFWWVMQFAMLAGFATAYPVNRWLIAKGIKEAM
jgi:hypothetical protein